MFVDLHTRMQVHEINPMYRVVKQFDADVTLMLGTHVYTGAMTFTDKHELALALSLCSRHSLTVQLVLTWCLHN